VELKDGGSFTTLSRYNVLEYFETDSRGYTVKCIRKNMGGGDMHSNLDSLTFEYGGLSHEGYDPRVPYYMAGGDDQWPTEVAYLTECEHEAKKITVIGKLAGEECFSEEYHLMLHCDPTPEYALTSARQLSFKDKNKDDSKDDSSDDKDKKNKDDSKDEKNKDDSKDDSSDGKDKKDKRVKDKDDSKDGSSDGKDKKNKDDSTDDSSDDKDKKDKRDSSNDKDKKNKDDSKDDSSDDKDKKDKREKDKDDSKDDSLDDDKKDKDDGKNESSDDKDKRHKDGKDKKDKRDKDKKDKSSKDKKDKDDKDKKDKRNKDKKDKKDKRNKDKKDKDPTTEPTPPPTPGPVPCFVEVTLECATEDGTECMDIVPPDVLTEEDCIETVCYTVAIDNTGEVVMDITVADFDINGNFLSLLTQIPVNPLAPGESTTVTTCGEIDICNGGEFCAIVNVEANPPNGDMCQDDDEYKFQPPTVPPASPPPTTPPSPLPTTLPTNSQCDVKVEIECATEDGLPCEEIVNPPIPSEEVCIETVCYTITIDNIGTASMEITVANFDLNGNLLDLLEQITTNPLRVGESTTVTTCGEIDICNGGEFCAIINVEANPPNGEMCQDDDQYKFQLPPPPPPPPTPAPQACDITLDATCVLADGPQAGLECSTPFLGFIECLERPTGATMLYNGGGCDQSDNSQPLKFTCQDMNGGPPTELGAESYIIVTDIKGDGITYFEGLVAVDSLYSLNDNGDRFAADMFIMIYTPDRTTLLQLVQYHSSCSQNLELKNRFGASQLVEFFNELQGLVSCFASYTLAFTINLPITATDRIELTSLTAMTSFTGGTFDLTNQVAGQVIGLGSPGVVVTLEDIPIDATVRELYTIIYNVEGIRVTNGEICTGMETISIEIGYDPPPPGPPPGPGGSMKIRLL